jgi:hypothetical protein
MNFLKKKNIGSTLVPSLFAIASVSVLSSCGKKDAPLSELKGSSSFVSPMGKGWDVNQEEWKGACVEGEIGFDGKQESAVNFYKSLSEKELAENLGFSLDAKARYGVMEGDLSAAFARDTLSNSYSESATYTAVYKFKNAILIQPKLTEVGERAFKAGPEKFVKACGHQYAEQKVLGARFFINIKMEFSSAAEKQSFSANGGLKGSLFGVRAKLQNAQESLSKSASVSVQLFQQGGNVLKILKSIESKADANGVKTQENQGSALVTCSMDKVDRCLEIIDNAIQYATDTKDAESFPNQVNSKNFDFLSFSGPAVLETLKVPYTNLAIFPLDPPTNASVEQSKKDLLKAFENQLKFKNRVESVVQGGVRLSLKQKADFENKNSEILGNMSKIVEAAKVCYSDFDKCTNASNKALAENNPDYVESAFDVVPETVAQ